MIINGRYGEARIFTDLVEQVAIDQIQELLNQSFAEHANLRIMPDVHAGKGCVIGTTMRVHDKICPNLVGVDIGCGMYTIDTGVQDINLQKFDRFIHEHIPAGFTIRDIALQAEEQLSVLQQLTVFSSIHNLERVLKSLGTLGGGNHFIELGRNKAGNIVLIIHTGSRNLGVQVATYYQKLAIARLKAKEPDRAAIVAQLKAEGRHAEIQHVLASLTTKPVGDHLAYLEGDDAKNYLHDMMLVQAWARQNRETIAREIMAGFFAKGAVVVNDSEHNHTVHNYIDDHHILRKGAIAARCGQTVTIPLNMRDGSLICIGLGNADWNYSAPHGAGRIMSRAAAKRSLSMDEFRSTMSGIYSSTVNEDTLDEAPMAYKSMETIINAIGETVEIVDHIWPIYNFKAAEE